MLRFRQLPTDRKDLKMSPHPPKTNLYRQDTVHHDRRRKSNNECVMVGDLELFRRRELTYLPTLQKWEGIGGRGETPSLLSQINPAKCRTLMSGGKENDAIETEKHGTKEMPKLDHKLPNQESLIKD